MTLIKPTILAIDPGPEISTYLVWDGKQILEKATVPNLKLMDLLDFDNNYHRFKSELDINFQAIEMVESWGMPMGNDTIETAYWVGIFGRTMGLTLFRRFSSSEIRLFLCGTKKAKPSNLKTAIINRVDPMRRFGKYGKGTIKNPGPLFGVSDHDWAALALAVTYWEIVQK